MVREAMGNHWVSDETGHPGSIAKDCGSEGLFVAYGCVRRRDSNSEGDLLMS